MSRGALVGRWVALAPAKINLGLFVGEPRADGRHELVSVMQSISLADELTLEPAPSTSECDEVLCPGVAGENLAALALALFRQQTGWSAPPVRLRIDKRVPVAAGLGGGSGDAAAALRLVSAASGLGDPRLLLDLAGELGADVPAQVEPGRWLATGAGELLERLPDPREPLTVLVLPHQGELSTASVYAQADRRAALRSEAELERVERSLREQLGGAATLPADLGLLHNDLGASALELCPEMDRALEQARQAGADCALVSGSGPTVLGLFSGSEGAARAERVAVGLAERIPAPMLAHAIDSSFARAHRPSVRNNADSSVL